MVFIFILHVLLDYLIRWLVWRLNIDRATIWVTDLWVKFLVICFVARRFCDGADLAGGDTVDMARHLTELEVGPFVKVGHLHLLQPLLDHVSLLLKVGACHLAFGHIHWKATKLSTWILWQILLLLPFRLGWLVRLRGPFLFAYSRVYLFCKSLWLSMLESCIKGHVSGGLRVRQIIMISLGSFLLELCNSGFLEFELMLVLAYLLL